MKQDPRTIVNTNEDHTFNKPTGTVVKPTTQKLYNLQWIRDKKDNRDYLYLANGTRVSNRVDLRNFCSPIENQGSLGSCTGQAIAGAIELLNKRNGKYSDISRLFIYYFERLLLGTVSYDSGAYIRDGIKSVSRYGASLERLWPYIVSKFKQRPLTEAINDALNRKVTRYERVVNHDGCIDALNNGYPIIIGFDVYPSFYRINRTGIMTYPNKRQERLLGGHAVLIVGYDAVMQHYIVRNSWGTGWGDKGYFYMPFSVIQDTSMSNDFWIIKEVSNP
jgi:hypothetical protein